MLHHKPTVALGADASPVSPFVAVAGATGALGQLVVSELRKRKVAVKAIVRLGTDKARTKGFLKLGGVTIAEVDLEDEAKLTQELKGATCVVSTLKGPVDVLLKAQSHLLDAALAAKVPRFIPSDYAIDLTNIKPGSNRNLDQHREFQDRLDESGISWSTILCGGFTEWLTGELGFSLIDKKNRKVSYISNPEQKLDYTTMANTAEYTAAVATDPKPTPKILRIAGDVVNVRELAEIAARLDSGGKNAEPYSTAAMAPMWLVGFMIPVMKGFGGEDELLPAWQGMQSMVNMFSGEGKLDPTDNDRYPEIKWTKVEEYLRAYGKGNEDTKVNE